MTILQIILIAAAILYILFTASDVSERQEVDMYLTVGAYVGINADQTALWFGTVPPGATGTRELVLTNEDNVDKTMHFEASGNLSDWIVLPQDTILRAKDRQSFIVKAEVPSGATYGNYTGKLIIILNK